MFKTILHIIFNITSILIFIPNLCYGTLLPELIIPDYSMQNTSNRKTESINNKDITSKSDKVSQVQNKENVMDSLNDIGFKFDEPKELIEPNLEKAVFDFNSKTASTKLLTAKIYKYSLYSGSGFFKIKLTLNKKQNSKSKTSNIIFAIDTSASCSAIQLTEIKKGIYNALSKLKKTKIKFNIIEFKREPNELFTGFMPINSNTISMAKAFLAKCSNNGYSNISTPLTQILQTAANEDNKNAPLVYLITDGTINSTSVKETTDFIRTIKNANKNSSALITYSNSKTADKTVLKLLAKTNHGICVTTANLAQSSTKLKNLILKTCSSNLKKISYKISNNVAGFVHPISISNILENNSFDIYGYYKENTKNINLKVSIKYNNQKEQDFYFILDIDSAKRTSENLEKKWGEQFVLHLYSNLINNYSKNLYNKIQTVTAKFGLNENRY